MLRGTDVMDMSGAMARGNRHQHKHSDTITIIKPLPVALTNGHGRYITVTTERTLVSVG
jgi:hypothetical protein